MGSIRDFIYFDTEKAMSLLSQFEWGKTNKTQIENSETREGSGEVSAGYVPFVGIKGQISNLDGVRHIQEMSMHHDLYNRLEKYLLNSDLLCEIPDPLDISEVLSSQAVRNRINKPYVKVEGFCEIDDFQRLINQSSKIGEYFEVFKYFVDNSKDIKEWEKDKYEKRKEIKKIEDPQKKAILERAIQEIDEKINEKTKVTNDDLIKNVGQLSDFLRLGMENVMLIRIYPYESLNNFCIVSNLRRNLLSDNEIEHLLYGYGALPNVKLSAMGLITSIPPQPSEEQFNPLSDINKQISDPSYKLQSGIRGLIPLFEQIENLFRYDGYPNILIQPIAIFRDFSFSNLSEKAE